MEHVALPRCGTSRNSPLGRRHSKVRRLPMAFDSRAPIVFCLIGMAFVPSCSRRCDSESSTAQAEFVFHGQSEEPEDAVRRSNQEPIDENGPAMVNARAMELIDSLVDISDEGPAFHSS